MNKKNLKLLILFISAIFYFIYLKFFVISNPDFYAGPLLVLADQEVPIKIMFYNSLTYGFPVVWFVFLTFL